MSEGSRKKEPENRGSECGTCGMLKDNVQRQHDVLINLKQDKGKQEELIRRLQMENAELILNIEKKKQEVEQLQQHKSTRSNKMAAAQVVIQQASISDLNDPNRPSRLAEKLSELYNNEWADAMEEMEVERGIPERLAIQHLLGIVCDAYRFCFERSDEFMDRITFNLGGIFSKELRSPEVMPKAINDTNIDYRKSLAEHVVCFLQQDFIKEAKAKPKVGSRTETYMKECVYVCWLMTVQEPKVYINVETPKAFDSDRYKPYTQNGKHIDFLVWPAVYLYEGGPLLSKGVVQPKK